MKNGDIVLAGNHAQRFCNPQVTWLDPDHSTGTTSGQVPATLPTLHSSLYFDAFWCSRKVGSVSRETSFGLILRKSLILGLRLGQSWRDQYVYLGFMYLWLLLVSALKHQQQILRVCEALHHILLLSACDMVLGSCSWKSDWELKSLCHNWVNSDLECGTSAWCYIFFNFSVNQLVCLSVLSQEGS